MIMNRKKQKSYIKVLLLVLVLFIVFFVTFFYTNNNSQLDYKWISKSELCSVEQNKVMDNAYIYCSSFDNIRKTKISYFFVMLILSCSSIMFILLIINISRKKEKLENKVIKNKKKNSLIASKFFDNQYESIIKAGLIEELKQTIYIMFCKLQIASMNFDYRTLKELLTPELFDKYYLGLEISKNKKRKNIINEFELSNISFIDASEDDEKYYVTVYLKVKFYRYIKNMKTNKIIKKQDNIKKECEHILKLIKYKHSKNFMKKCGKCGAFIENYLLSNCEYCRSEIINDVNEWLICEKEVINSMSKKQKCKY